MSPHPITEDDLHGFVDESLDSIRHAEVAVYLAAHAEVAARVAAWRAQRQQLRAALAPIAAEPLPPELNLRRMLGVQTQSPSLHRLPYWAVSAVASVLLLIGGASGWLLRGANDVTDLLALGHDAIASYSVYAPDSFRPVELRAEDQALLTRWAQERIGRPLAIPELTSAGYRFMGGRIVASVRGAAVLLMYDDDKGTRLVMLAQPMPDTRHATMSAVSDGEVHGFVWSDSGLGYSLVGSAPQQTLHPLANTVRQQIKEKT